jgi:hypothetical protein
MNAIAQVVLVYHILLPLDTVVEVIALYLGGERDEYDEIEVLRFSTFATLQCANTVPAILSYAKAILHKI